MNIISVIIFWVIFNCLMVSIWCLMWLVGICSRYLNRVMFQLISVVMIQGLCGMFFRCLYQVKVMNMLFRVSNVRVVYIGGMVIFGLVVVFLICWQGVVLVVQVDYGFLQQQVVGQGVVVFMFVFKSNEYQIYMLYVISDCIVVVEEMDLVVNLVGGVEEKDNCGGGVVQY